jgi:hypothetical protein
VGSVSAEVRAVQAAALDPPVVAHSRFAELDQHFA